MHLEWWQGGGTGASAGQEEGDDEEDDEAGKATHWSESVGAGHDSPDGGHRDAVPCVAQEAQVEAHQNEDGCCDCGAHTHTHTLSVGER